MSENARTAELLYRREDLARALARLQSTVRQAAEALNELRNEKKEMEGELRDLRESLEQERKNSTQFERIANSNRDELREASARVEVLTRKREEQETLLREQLEAIARLEEELQNSKFSISNAELGSMSSEKQIAELQNALKESEGRLESVTKERDAMKAMLYEREREDSSWALRLTEQEKVEASTLLDTLIDRVGDLEERFENNTNGRA